jgi:cell division protein FtsZ
MSYRGLALMGTGYSSGTNAAYDAAKAAIESPLLDNISIDGAMGVLVHFDIHPSYPIMEISEAMNIIEDSADPDASVIFGTTTNSNLEIDEVKITIIATGFEDKDAIPSPTRKNNKPKKSNSAGFIGGAASSSEIAKKVACAYDGEHDDILEIPTFLRRQMD